MSSETATREEPPTLDEIRANLLEVRNHVQFNIGSPQAIDHLLISIVSVIDAIQRQPPTGGEK